VDFFSSGTSKTLSYDSICVVPPRIARDFEPGMILVRKRPPLACTRVKLEH
jgi:hypothetical protein